MGQISFEDVEMLRKFCESDQEKEHVKGLMKERFEEVIALLESQHTELRKRESEEVNRLSEELSKAKSEIEQLNLEIEKKQLEQSKPSEEEKNTALGILKEIKQGMFWVKTCPFTWLIRNSYRYTEKYYNWLLPFVKIIDEEIPGFSKSWSSHRRSFEGMLGLVRAATGVMKINMTKEK